VEHFTDYEIDRRAAITRRVEHSRAHARAARVDRAVAWAFVALYLGAMFLIYH